jgi:dUTP pyrophosphatase
MTEIKIRLLSPEGRVPERMSHRSSGCDLFASKDSIVPAATASTGGGVDVGRALIPLGIAIELPIDTVGRIASRSGLSVNSNLEVGAGWIDSDYRGEVMVELKNFSSSDFEIRQGDRVAQLILLPIIWAQFVVDEELGDTSRGTGGFGSTGI